MATVELDALLFARLSDPTLRQEIRERSLLSRAELADAVGVGPETIWRWERGLRRPSGMKGRRYCEILHELAGRVLVTSDTATPGLAGRLGVADTADEHSTR